MSAAPNGPPTHGPELFIGIAGAVGTDLEMVSEVLQKILDEVGYRGCEIGLSSLLDLIDWSGIPKAPTIDDVTLDRHIWTRMDAGDSLRERLERGDALALLAILSVTQRRTTPNEPLQRTAFIFRSLKHPEEVTTLRHVYGPNFFLISAYSPIATRAEYLERRVSADWERLALPSGDRSAAGTARDLIERDVREAHRDLGQRLGDTFPKADFFVDARHRTTLERDLRRFLELLFDHPFHTPTKHENAMFHSQAAALRSAAPSRQVGCAIADAEGEMLALGTNEVPKPGGGQYWSDDSYDMRDHNRDNPDISGSEKSTVVEQILRRLKQARWLKEEHSDAATETFNKLLAGLRVQSLIEFERAVHAEMSALISAGRRGTPVVGAYAYTTTFPCHECTRHLIASGISRVYYIEPYPKSLAERLHEDAVVIDPSTIPADRVAFLPFVGVAPRRYMELFTPGPEGRKREGRVAAASPGWLPKGVPATQPVAALEERPADDVPSPPAGEEPAAPSAVDDPGKNGTRKDESGAGEPFGAASGSKMKGGGNATPLPEHQPAGQGEGEPEKMGDDEAVEADLSENTGIALGPTELTVEMSSDALYILREGNVLVELDEAMEAYGIDFQEEQE